MSATVKLILRPDKERPDGTVPVYLRATYARRTRQTATGIWIEPKKWNPAKQEVRKSHPLYKTYNAKLEDELNKARVAATRALSADDVIAALGAGAGSFTAFLKERAETRRAEHKERAAAALETLGKKIHAALGYPWPDGAVPWNALTPPALERFVRHCRTARKNNPNTVRRDLYRLQTLCKRAVRTGVLTADRDPFMRFTIPKGGLVTRRRLTLAELDALRSLDLEWGTRPRAVRDAFLFAVFAHGMRISDLVRLTAANLDGLDGDEPRVVYRTQKTAAPLAPKLPPAAVEIVRPYAEAARPGHYLFPLMNRGEDADPTDIRRRQTTTTIYFNRHLKALGEAAGIGGDGLSSHVARHSFADLARRKGDLFAISKALGHSKLATTQTYLASFDRAAVDALTDNLWNGKD